MSARQALVSAQLVNEVKFSHALSSSSLWKRRQIDSNGHILTKEGQREFTRKFSFTISKVYESSDWRLFQKFRYISDRLYRRLGPVSLLH